MEERPFTERFKEIMIGLRNNPGSFLHKIDCELMWACAKEIEAMRQEITELKQQLNGERAAIDDVRVPDNGERVSKYINNL